MERTAEVHVLALVGMRPFAGREREAAIRAAIASRLDASGVRSLGRLLRHWERRWTALSIDSALQRVSQLVAPLSPVARAELLRDAEALLVSTASPAALDLAETDCVIGVFERTCEGGEPFGCGMFGHALALGDGSRSADPAAARALLESRCAELGMFPCAVLGELRARGAFGAGERDRANEALLRACETGYSPSCDQTVDTFAIDLLPTEGAAEPSTP